MRKPRAYRRLRAFGVVVASVLAISACGMAQPRSERVFDDREIGNLQPGISRSDLFARLGPPADEQTYRNLNESVASWRLLEPGGHRMMLNAHFDPSGRVKYYSRTLDPTTTGSDSSR